jgi:hypothetical protein
LSDERRSDILKQLA